MKSIIAALVLAILMATVATAQEAPTPTAPAATEAKASAKTPTLPDLEAEFQGLQVQLQRLKEISLTLEPEALGKRMQEIVARMNEVQKLAAPMIKKDEAKGLHDTLKKEEAKAKAKEDKPKK